MDENERRELITQMGAEILQWRERAERAERERDEARRWAEQHITLTCAFCGAVYPAEGASPKLLEEHVRVCPAHPMRQVEATADRRLALLRDMYESRRVVIDDWIRHVVVQIDRATWEALAAELKGTDDEQH